MCVTKTRVSSVVACRLDNVSFGDIPPKLLGVLILDSADEVVCMDLEVRYYGNPDIAVKAGGVKMSVGEFRVALKIRVELNNFVDRSVSQWAS